MEKKIIGLKKVIALPGGCVTLAHHRARLHLLSGRSLILSRAAEVISRDRGEILLSTGRKVLIFTAAGKRRVAPEKVSPGITAMRRVPRGIICGFIDGSIELISIAREGLGKPRIFEGTPSSPVVQLYPGPRGTVAAGFANGMMGVWNIENGSRLHQVRLNGPVKHILFEGSRLHLATVLGNYLSLNVEIFSYRYCDLLKKVWRQVPVIWSGGLPVRRNPQKDHFCNKVRVTLKEGV